MRSGMAIVSGLLLVACPQVVGPAERVSVSSAGTQGDGISGAPSISADGRYVAFESDATNLVPGDVNGTTDVFVRDRLLGTTVRPVTSLNASGSPAEGAYDPMLGADGRYLSFTSSAPDLVPGDTNDASDVFLMDLRTGAIERIDLTSSGAEATGGISWGSDISADGRYVTFTSRATNLLPGRDKNHGRGADAFVRDRLTGTTTLVSVALDGLNGRLPSYARGISADGRYAAFTSSADDLLPDGARVVGLYVRDLWTGTTTRESLTSTGAPASVDELQTATMSRDGRYVTFGSAQNDVVPGDTNNARDIFLRDRITGEVELISVAGDGTRADGDSWAPRVSDGGRCVVFVSDATTLVPGDTNGKSDLFVRDRRSGTTTRLTVDRATGGDADGDTDGTGRSDDTTQVALRPDGSETVFPSDATNLVPGDTNAAADVFVRDTGCG